MQYDFNHTAKSIATIFFAAKIYKALNKYVARKESYVTDDYVSLEDYLFDGYEFDKIDHNHLENLIVIDYTGNILNLSGSKYITESELVNFKNGSNVTARIDFNIDVNNTKQVTTVIAGTPQTIEVTGQISTEDIIIKEGVSSNEVEVYDTKTGNLIARIKLVISEKVKPLVNTILEKIRKMFANDTIRKPFAYVIGLISGFVIMPIYNKVKRFFRSKQENMLYFETVAEDEPNENIDKNEVNKVNKITNKIIALISSLFRGVGKILRPFVQFLIALLNGSRMIVMSLLATIIQLSQTLRSLFVVFLTMVASIFIGTAGLTARGIEKVGELTNIQPVISFAQALRKVLIKLSDKLGTFAIKEGALKPSIIQLKTLYYQSKMALEQNIKILEDLMNKSTDEIKPKLVKIVNNLIDKAIIKTVTKSILIVTKSATLVRNKSIALNYKQLADTVIDYITYLSNILSTVKFINEFMRNTATRDKINKMIDEQLKAIDSTISQLETYESEIESFGDAIAQLNRIKQSLVELRIS
ncbi:MAG: hypothetical protein QXW35_05770 [Candidatus Aenigmatarchaeota archaeon]